MVCSWLVLDYCLFGLGVSWLFGWCLNAGNPWLMRFGDLFGVSWADCG